jgi:hypothetical protein
MYILECWHTYPLPLPFREGVFFFEGANAPSNYLLFSVFLPGLAPLLAFFFLRSRASETKKYGL